MHFDVEKLWTERKQAYFKEILPYTKYVGQSGLLLVIAFIGIVALDQYFSFIRNIPEAFPIAEAGAVIWATLIIYNPLRTWLREPDIIYLMPQEKVMQTYIWLSGRRSFLLSALLLVIGIIFYWPIYRASAQTNGFLIIITLVICKLANYIIKQEGRKLVQHRLQFFLSFCQYVLTIFALYAMLKSHSILVLLVFVVTFTVIFMSLRKMNGSFFPWQYYIAEERRTRQRINRFLSWFVDIPSNHSHVKKRAFLSSGSKLIPYQSQSAFTYLHYLTFARTEIGGIYIRLIVVGTFVTYIFADMELWNSYGALFCFLFFCFLISMQLTTLRQVHRNSVWRFIFPVSLNLQHVQMTRLETILSIIAFCFILVVGYIPYWSQLMLEELLYPLIGAAVLLAWRTLAMKRSLAKQIEED